MRGRLGLRRPPASAVAALVVLLVILGLVLLSYGGSGSGSGGSPFGSDLVLRPGQVAALPLGASQRDVERRFGKGAGALDSLEDTGVAVEPMDASCIYYRAARDNFYDVAQFCLRHDRLVSRRVFLVPTA